MNLLSKNIGMLQKEILHEVHFQKLVSRENLALKHARALLNNQAMLMTEIVFCCYNCLDLQ